MVKPDKQEEHISIKYFKVLLTTTLTISGLEVSVKRPSYYGKKNPHAEFVLKWKGNAKMISMVTLLMVGVGVYGRDTITR